MVRFNRLSDIDFDKSGADRQIRPSHTISEPDRHATGSSKIIIWRSYSIGEYDRKQVMCQDLMFIYAPRTPVISRDD